MAGVHDWRDVAVSALDWWREAGVDTLVDEAPRDWFARETGPAATARAADEPPPTRPVERPLPATLEAFLDWRFGGEAPEADWGEPLVLPSGDPAAPLMIVTDMPEAEDFDAGTLLSGAAGRLLDRMLAAIGHSRASVYIVPLCAARPVTGLVPPEVERRLGELLRHHLVLTAPASALFLGQAVGRAVFGADAGAARGRLQPINYQGGILSPVATLHPRWLLQNPARKANAWKDLQLLIGGQNL